MLKNILILLTTFAVILFLLSKRVRNLEKWQATVTPLASIIGSGFLIIAPLLAHILGSYAFVGILALVILGYFCGSALRYNMLAEEKGGKAENQSATSVEGANSNDSVKSLLTIDNFSQLILGLAYIISVTFYLKLLAAFALKGLKIDSSFLINLLTSAILISIGLIGKFRGLNLLEKLEEYSVSIKLAIIAGFVVGLAYVNLHLVFAGSWQILAEPKTIDFNSVRVLFGSLIVVQGFETSRFLTEKYKTRTLVETMRYAQIGSAIIYLVFVGLIMVVFQKSPEISDTAVIDLSGRIASVLPVALIVAAVMSQFSAAVADTIGSAGLIVAKFERKISRSNSYVIIAALALALTWVTDIFEIISLASRAFALYYGMQSVRATRTSFKSKQYGRSFLFGLLSLVLFAIVIFGDPAKV